MLVVTRSHFCKHNNVAQIKTITTNVPLDVGVLSFGFSSGLVSVFNLLEPLTDSSLDGTSSFLFWNQL